MPGVGSRPFSKADQVGESRVARKLKARAAEATATRTCYAIVNERDAYRCRICQRAGNPHAISLLARLHHHHLIYRSRGGDHVPEAVILICALCHDLVHVQGTLRITGDADERDERGRLNGLRVDRLTEMGWQLERMC